MAKKSKAENYLDYVPSHNPDYKWVKNDEGIVTIIQENNKFFDKVAQKFFKRPAVSRLDMDPLGSYIWTRIDGKTTVYTIGKAVHTKFGKEAEPLYDRLVKFIYILESNGYIKLDKTIAKENLKNHTLQKK